MSQPTRHTGADAAVLLNVPWWAQKIHFVTDLLKAPRYRGTSLCQVIARLLWFWEARSWEAGTAAGGTHCSQSTPQDSHHLSVTLRQLSVSESVGAMAAQDLDGAGAALGKRMREEEEDDQGPPKQRQVIYVPASLVEDIGLSGVQQFLQPAAVKPIEDKSGSKIELRGQGVVPPDGNLEGAEESLHVLLEGSDEALAIAQLHIEKLLNDPAEIAKMKTSLTRKHKVCAAAVVYAVHICRQPYAHGASLVSLSHRSLCQRRSCRSSTSLAS